MTELIVTEGIVLGKRGIGEANTLVAILTKEHGLLKVSAKSARREQSKLRYALEPFTEARYSMVRGRYEWKLVGAQDAVREFSRASAPARGTIGRVAKLLQRLVHGEEHAPELFEVLKEGIALVLKARSREELESVECVLVLRILFHLGYLPKTPELAPFIAQNELSLELASQAAVRRSALIRAINESLVATGL
jgi:DNA repair protein RecO (recombination protein O)